MNPRYLRKFTTRTRKYLQKAQCLEKMKKLHVIPTNQFTPQHQQKYNNVLEFIITTRLDVKTL